MPRANRVFIPEMVWHITHRCHKKEFLLKFQRDRLRWRYWLYQAKKRFGLTVLNYIVTSNHIHLLVFDTGKDVIPKSMQLIAGRTAQEFNLRKGAFWEDRYHATAVDSDEHLIRCLVYIDLNMVRTGVIRHPSQWHVSGYNEIQTPLKRYAVINRELLTSLCKLTSINALPDAHRQWVDNELAARSPLKRIPSWTESIAMGDETFVTEVKNKLGISARYRTVNENDDGYELNDERSIY